MPPVNDWVSALPARGFHLDRLIPLVFHVDYWDYLGWPDHFAQSDFTKRQRQLARWNRSRTIYTPQLVLQGQNFRHRGRFQTVVEQINQLRPGRRLLSK